MDTWDDKQIRPKANKLKVVAENVQLLGGRPPVEATAAERGRQDERATTVKSRRAPNQTKTRFPSEGEHNYASISSLLVASTDRI